MSFTTRNHYVAQWYQKRFMEDPKGKLFYLDLHPELTIHKNGGHHYRKALRRLGTKECFKDDNLYTINFGEHASDIIEKSFFGPIDSDGADSLHYFSDYVYGPGAHAESQHLMTYMDAQRNRTPKGLDFLKSIGMTDDHQKALILMGNIWQAYITMWMEGVHEIVSCDDSPTKFIISDHPVTTYNRKLFPGNRNCQYPYDAPIHLLGTHTIFPLWLNRCLIITNLGYVRNPTVNPLRERENPRFFAQTMLDLRTIQTGRQVPEDYVTAINHILKSRARRYIAASREEWLYPEKHLGTTQWDKLGGKVFLMPDPRKVKFTTDFSVGYKDGSVWGQDEYGRLSDERDPRVKKLREKEWREFQNSKNVWDSIFGKLDTEDWIKYM